MDKKHNYSIAILIILMAVAVVSLIFNNPFTAKKKVESFVDDIREIADQQAGPSDLLAPGEELIRQFQESMTGVGRFEITPPTEWEIIEAEVGTIFMANDPKNPESYMAVGYETGNNSLKEYADLAEATLDENPSSVISRKDSRTANRDSVIFETSSNDGEVRSLIFLIKGSDGIWNIAFVTSSGKWNSNKDKFIASAETFKLK
jgi:hypothetical protein